MSNARSPLATLIGQDPTWWASGLALAERVVDRPASSVQADPPGDPTDRARRRLERWRGSHGSMASKLGLPAPADGGTGSLAARLAELDLDEAGLLALLAEPPAALAGRRTRPAWARFVEEVVAAAGAEPRVPDGELTWAAGFTAIVAPFVETTTDRFVAALTANGAASDVDVPAVRDGFCERLSTELVSLAARTLVLELNVLRVTGGLTGTTPHERFVSFLRHFTCGSGLATLLGEYVVLARLIAQACANAVEVQVELLRRLVADRDAVVATLLGGVDPGPLVAVDSRGDLHQGGRSVAVLRFAGGARVVYKPRPVAVHARFNAVLRWLNRRVTGLDLRELRSVARAGYGWVEFAAHEPCRTEDEVADFYRRLGSLAALLYALDATDIHCENLIASGDQPVVVDLETVLHPTLPGSDLAPGDPARDAAARSVRRILLLPTILIGAGGALDLSGLGGDLGATNPFEQVGWSAPGTDEMRLIRVSGTFPGAENRPRLRGTAMDPAEYVDVLVAGFRVAYDAIVTHRRDLVGPEGLLRDWADDEIRIVPRATRMYATVLDESTHPDVMRDALDRDRIIDLWWIQAMNLPVLRRMFRHEVADAWAGDVPVFFGRPGSCDLWTSRGQRLAAVLTESSLDRASRKINEMNLADRSHQEWIIRASLATRGTPDGHPERSRRTATAPALSVVTDSERLLAAARAVADRIVGSAFSDRTRVNWLGMEVVDGPHWVVRPLSAGFTHGYSGVAVFLAQLCALTGVDRYGEYAIRALRAVPQVLDGLTADPARVRAGGCGLEGLGGLAYALARTARLLGESEAAGWVTATVDLASTVVDDEAGSSVLTGVAGGLASMLAVHGATALPAAWTTAQRCAERLTARAAAMADGGDPAARAGFAYGATGAGWALLRFAAAGGGDPFHKCGLAALERESWAPTDEPRRGWCQGTVGQVLAYAEVPGWDGRDGTDALGRVVEVLRGAGPLENHSLCHGELGALEALTVAAAHNEVAAATLTTRTAYLLDSIERWGPICGTPNRVESPGLLSGLAGIGYGLLRAGFAERVPSVLLLQPDPAPPIK